MTTYSRKIFSFFCKYLFLFKIFLFKILNGILTVSLGLKRNKDDNIQKQIKKVLGN